MQASLHAGLVSGCGEPPATGGHGAGDLVPVCRPEISLAQCLPLVMVRLNEDHRLLVRPARRG